MLKSVLIAAALAALALPSWAQTPHRTEQVRFARGSSATAMMGSIRADGGVDYILPLRAGQTLEVLMRTRNASARFNVMAPGMDEPLFNGSNARDYVGRTPVGGAYRIIVYMTEEAAMRDEIADYVVAISVND